MRIVTPPHSQQNGCLKLDFGSGACRPVHSSEKGLPLVITFFEISGPAARFTGKSKIFLRKMPRAARRKIAIFARWEAFFNRNLMPDGCTHHGRTPTHWPCILYGMPTLRPRRKRSTGSVHANAKLRLQATLHFLSLQARLRFPLHAGHAQTAAHQQPLPPCLSS